MSGNDQDEPMEVSTQDDPADEEVLLTLSLKLLDNPEPDKFLKHLEKLLQSWFNNCKIKTDCWVKNIFKDERAVIKLKPAPGVAQLQKLCGQTLKAKKCKLVATVCSISLESSTLIEPSQDALVSLPVAQLQEREQPGAQGPPGAQWKSGAQGTSGAQWVSGAQGLPGTQSELGAQGPPGAQWGSGAQGPPGVQWGSGAQGPPEAQWGSGAQGPPGAQWGSGAQGPPGAQWGSGAHWPPGTQWGSGAQGPPGAQWGSGAQGPPGAMINSLSTAAENESSCFVSVSQYWYLTQIYSQQLQQIMTNNRVEMEEELKVSLKAVDKDGDPQKALLDLTNLVQSVDTGNLVVPLKYVDSDKWKEALEFTKKKDKKLLLYLSSENVTTCGPIASCDAVSEILNANPHTHALISFSEYKITPEDDSSLTIKMTVSDPFTKEGINIEKSYWKLMNNSFNEKIENIKDKFHVDLKEADAAPGTVTVRVSYKRAGGNNSMESHAIRALLRLYQKIATSPKNSDWPLMKSMNGWKGSEAGSSMDGEIHDKSDADLGAAAAAGDDNEDQCPICRDTFTDKTQLKCKHEFCKECLRRAKESMGSVCPVCREVFGLVEGNQPDGSMNWSTIYQSLPGFAGCNTIEIVYQIPSGIQTKKHPNPGLPYSGIMRQAYLPDNREGKEVLRLLKKAFDQKLIFTIGTSRTTGLENSVTWNDIHHKTSRTGGPISFGYPDPDYLSRVKEELKAKGIK